MDGPLISIVTPAYNCARTIEQTVQSVREQRYTHWEMLILDDGSSDDSLRRIEALSQEDGRIRAFRNERNLGVGSTRNRGVQLARGEWVAFLDSDDIWRPEKLEKQLTLLQRQPEAKLLFTGSGFMSADGQPLDYVLHVPERIDRRQLLRQNLLSCSSALAERELLLRHPFPARQDMHEDFAVWLEILEEEPWAYGVDEPLLVYRRSAASKSGNKLRAARMNWNTYRYVGLGLPLCLYNMAWYTLNGLRKYKNF